VVCVVVGHGPLNESQQTGLMIRQVLTFLFILRAIPAELVLKHVCSSTLTVCQNRKIEIKVTVRT